MKKKISTICLVVLVMITFLPACKESSNFNEKDNVKQIKEFLDASLTIFPLNVFWTGKQGLNEEERAWVNAYKRGFRERAVEFAETLGLLLEEKGFEKYEIADVYFEYPEEQSGHKERTEASCKFVGGLDLNTDYVLFTKFILRADKSGLYVYSVIVDANGQIAWEDSQEHRGRTEFDCLEEACNSLIPVLHLDKMPKKEMAEDKKRMLWEIRAKEPPSGSEFAAMDKRLETMKKALANANMLVYPARVGGDHTDPNCAPHLSKLINEAKLCQASAAEIVPVIEGAGWPNEMQVLWLFARNVREYVRQHPAESDYVLFADYWFAPSGIVWAVHFVVCDRAGEWVVVDLQNSHQEAFGRINPQNLEDCDRLVLDRLEIELR